MSTKFSRTINMLYFTDVFLGNVRFFKKNIPRRPVSLALLFSNSDNLLTVHEQLSYYQFNQSSWYCVILQAEGWFMLHKKVQLKLVKLCFIRKILVMLNKKDCSWFNNTIKIKYYFKIKNNPRIYLCKQNK